MRIMRSFENRPECKGRVLNKCGGRASGVLRFLRNTFTLIELLIVVAIIAILASMLLPALRTARDRSWSIVCIGNLRQNGVAFNTYASDFNGYYHLRGPNDRTWFQVLINAGIYESLDSMVARCPSEKYILDGGHWSRQTTYGSDVDIYSRVIYDDSQLDPGSTLHNTWPNPHNKFPAGDGSYNRYNVRYLGTANHWDHLRRASAIGNPAKFVAIIDTWRPHENYRRQMQGLGARFNYPTNAHAIGAGLRHQGRANALRWDGSAGGMGASQLGEAGFCDVFEGSRGQYFHRVLDTWND